MSRRKARILAFQTVYSWDVSKTDLDDLLTFSWLEKDNTQAEGLEKVPSAAEKEERTFASLIASGTVDHIDEIDEIIKNHLSASWSFDRINKVTLAILRISIYEIKYQKSVDPKIVIDEAVNISKEFGTDDSFKFINAVLDKIGKDA